jgi:TolB protein
VLFRAGPPLSLVRLWTVAGALVGCGAGEGRSGEVGAAEGAAAGPAAAVGLAAPGRLIYLAEGAETVEIRTILPSGQGSKALLAGTMRREGPSIFPGPVSPDGAHLVVIEADDSVAGHLEVIEIRPLTAEGLGAPRWRSDVAPQVRNPSWAPDGRSLAFEASFESFRDLYRVDLEADGGSSLHRVTDHAAGNYEPSWSPDGREIAFTSSRDGDPEIYVVGRDGGEARRITASPGDDYAPSWSPEGSMIAFISGREGVERIYGCRPDGSQLRRLSAEAAASGPGWSADEAEPAWSPDGRWLVFSARTGAQRAGLRVVSAADGATRALTPGTASDRAPVWSPDGAFVAFTSDRSGDPELYGIAIAGGEAVRLSDRPGADWLARWVPR